MSSAILQSGSGNMRLDEQLQQFGRLAADALDELMMLAVSGAAAQEHAEAAGQMLQGYGELVQFIGQTAADCGLNGLQAVCVLIETNLLLLREENRALSADEHALLEGWPMLLYGYMSGNADQESSAALLQNLAATWPLTLTGEAAAETLEQLTGQAGASAMAGEVPGSAAAQQVEREMLSILAAELGQMGDQFSIGQALAAQDTEEQQQAILDNYGDFLERLQLTAESVGLVALGALLARLHQQIDVLPSTLSGPQLLLLQQLPERLASYLADPCAEDATASLAALLADAAWPSPITAAVAAEWQGALANVQLTDSMAQAPERASRAEKEDVSLALPDDVNADLLDGLLQELPVQVAAFTAAIAHIAGGQGNLSDAEQAMRAAHTLKGAANTVGVHGIANLTHHLEDILVALIAAGKMPPRALADVLINAGDCLESMSEFLQGTGPAPEHALEVLQEVLDQANRIDREGIDAAATELAAAELPLAAEARAEPPGMERKADEPAPTVEQALRVPAPLVDELLRLAGETLISNSQIQEYLSQSIAQATIIRKQHQLFQQLVAELEDLVDIRGINSPNQAAAHGNGFDALEFEHYSELHTISRRLIEAATDAQEMTGVVEGQLAALDDLLEEQRRLQMANQHAVMRTRMVAVSSVISRLQRGVRQTGRLLDKTVELSIKGEHTTIDSHVLNDLMDPLMHILRNAVDHGIEAPAVRVAAGKPAHGRIELSFAREGNSIVVRCRDDGAGLDYASIRRIAERKGMLKPEHDHTEDELARLVLAPGFSTREEASQVSGRGVGMDVVYSRVQAMKGMLALNSQTGQGLSVELRLPAALLATHTLIVRQRDRRLAISSRGVEDIRYATRDQIVEIGARQFFREGEKLYALARLEELLTMAYDRRVKDREGFPVLLTRLDDGTVSAVQVQEMLDSREVVMKKFGRYVPRSQGVIGAVILGDGGVAPVIDLVDLLRAPVQRTLAGQDEVAADEKHAASDNPRALVVDDSLSARRALAQVMRDAGYDVRMANDGLDAVNMLEKFSPDIILSDMEMPRMSGIELTANVRRSARTKHIPVIMITSRSTEKHRQMSAAAGVDVHMVKPFNDETLLQHVSRLTTR
ncbi:MAG TPA: response regulator [Sideroxyarcus sp.]|nr:response regulator [Sideroxyarcus sp.]